MENTCPCKQPPLGIFYLAKFIQDHLGALGVQVLRVQEQPVHVEQDTSHRSQHSHSESVKQSYIGMKSTGHNSLHIFVSQVLHLASHFMDILLMHR